MQNQSDIFAGLKVIDAASFLAGPCAATIFSDYGADVIKVEPLGGDRHRSIAAGHPSEWSWQLTDRNRKDIALDITAPAGYDVLCTLVESADVLVVNFTNRQLAKFKLEYETVKQVNPRLIMAQVTGYGTTGKDADRRAFDLTGWFARTGILDMMHDKDAPPTIPAGGVGDHATAMTLYAGILTALYRRDRTGQGAMVSTSLATMGAWANGLNLQGVIAGVDGAARRDTEGWSNPIQNIYTTADERHVLIAVQNILRDWPTFIDAIDRPQWREDERLKPVKALFSNRFYAREQIAAAIGEISSEVLCQRLDERGIVYSLVARNAEVIDDEQLIANDLIVPMLDPLPGAQRTFATPLHISDSPQRKPQRAPRIGEHTEEILRDAGFDQEQIEQLFELGVVAKDKQP